MMCRNEPPVKSASGDVAAGLGGDLAPWVYGIASTLAGDKSDKAAVPYNKAMKQLGQSALAGDAWVIVSWGQVLTTVKMMNQIESDKAGKVTAIMATNGDPVEFGQPLFVIE